MKLQQLLKPTTIIYNATADSKKGVLGLISQAANALLPELDPAQILESLVGREKLGSTGIGHGVAIPHCRVKNLTFPIGVFVHLAQAIDFDAIDGKPVDLFFGLLVPEEATEEQLAILAMLAEKLGNKELRSKLRQAQSEQELYELLTN